MELRKWAGGRGAGTPKDAGPEAARSDASRSDASRSDASRSGVSRSGVVGSENAGERGLAGVNLRYFGLRAVIFGAVLAVVLVLGVNGVLAFALAIVISGLISYPLALRQRRTVVDIMENRRGGRR